MSDRMPPGVAVMFALLVLALVAIIALLWAGVAQ